MRSKPIIAVSLSAILIIGQCFAVAAAEEKTPFCGEINADGINLRSDATVSSFVIATLNRGEQVEVVSEFYGWYKVHLPASVAVYLKSGLAQCLKYAEGAQDIKNNCLSAKVLKERVNVRLAADSSSAIIGIADKNEIINVRGEGDGWYKIEPIRNSFGWVNKKFVNRATAVKPGGRRVDEKGSPADSDTLALKGRLSPYGMVFKRIATHKLITEDNKVFLLRGNRDSLNALNRSRVKVIGKVISPVKAKYPVLEVMTIEAEN